MKQTLNKERFNALAKTLTSIKDQSLMERFLKDLLSMEELKSISARWEVVSLLKKELTYREISEKTGVSTTTVTRIANSLNYGEGSFLEIIDKK